MPTAEGFLRKPRKATSQSVDQTVIDGNQEGGMALSLLPEKRRPSPPSACTQMDYTAHHRLEFDSDTAEPKLLALHFPVLAFSLLPCGCV